MVSLQNRADYRLTLEGRNLGLGAGNLFSEILRSQFAETISPRLLALTLTEKSGGEADQLDITLHDHDGKLEIPQPGAVLSLQLGWASGPDVTPGLIDKGRFKVDEAEWSGPPDIITIRARSADFAASFNQRQEKSHTATTIGAIIRAIASAQKLAVAIDSTLAAIKVEAIDQDGISDAALLRLLGRRYDATATVKNGTLIFSASGSANTANGKAIPPATLTRLSGDRYRYRRGERGQFGGVEARWHDKASGTRKTVSVGGGDKPPKRLKRIYANEAAAQEACRSAQGKMARAKAEFEMELALGRPDLFPERPMSLSGFKPEIDSTAWVVRETTHTLDANGGLASVIRLNAT